MAGARRIWCIARSFTCRLLDPPWRKLDVFVDVFLPAQLCWHPSHGTRLVHSVSTRDHVLAGGGLVPDEYAALPETLELSEMAWRRHPFEQQRLRELDA